MAEKKIQVLIIEKETLEFQSIKEYLSTSNQSKLNRFLFDVTEVDFFSDIPRLLANKNIDLVILCVQRYGEIAKKILGTISASAPYLPIIVVSPSNNEGNIEKIIKAGAQDYLVRGGLNGAILAHVALCAIERKKIENLLKEYASIVEYSNEAIMSINLDGMITSWNHAAEKMFGYEANEAMSENIFRLFTPDIQEDINQIKTMGNGYKPALKREVMITCKNLENKNILISISPIREKQKHLIGCSIIAYDTADYNTAEKNQLIIQYKIATLLAESADLFEASLGILRAICESLGWQVGEMWVIDPDKKWLQRISVWTVKEYDTEPITESIKRLSETKYKLGEGLHGHIWKIKNAYFVTNISRNKEINYLSDYKNMGLKSCFGFPIVFQKEVMGVVVFFNQYKCKPDDHFLLTTQALGTQIGTFIKRKRIEGDLLFLAKHDTLTGLSNRGDFEDSLNRALIHAKRYNRLLAIMYLDLDYFKKINDTLGHEKGDLLLLEAAKRLQQVVRRTDSLARFGGDEFVILLSQVASTESVTAIAHKIIDVFSKPCLLDGREYNTSVSIGISMYPRDGHEARTLLKNADMAMYLSKAKGRNNFQFCPPAMVETAARKIKLAEDLQYALLRNEFLLCYQPIVDMHTRQVTAFEALIRWNHPSGNTLFPSEFIRIAEQNDLIQHIGEWVIHTACSQVKNLHLAGFNSIQMAINISVFQLTRNFLNIIGEALKQVQLDPAYLTIELTETTLMENSDNNIYLLRGLRELGVQISIDDFGTGYSSLAYLTKFTINSIKIDRSFVSVLMEDTSSAIIVGAITAMAHSLNMRVIAEGVETQNQLDILQEKKCDEYQGEFCSYPLLPNQLIEFLQKGES